MTVIAFPPPTMTEEDVAAVVARLRREGHYSCRLEATPAGHRSLTLLDAERRERGRVTKRHGKYVVADARGHPVLRTRRLGEVLEALAG